MRRAIDTPALITHDIEVMRQGRQRSSSWFAGPMLPLCGAAVASSILIINACTLDRFGAEPSPSGTVGGGGPGSGGSITVGTGGTGGMMSTATASATVGPGGSGGTGGTIITGGGGTGGTVLTGGGGTGPTVLGNFDASSPNLTSYSYDNLPGWLTFKSPNDGSGGAPERTSQIAADELVRGYTTANVPRARNADGTGWGLNIENERTNFLPYSDDMEVATGGWVDAGGPTNQNYMAAVENQADPTGGTNAVQYTIDDCTAVSTSQWSRRYAATGGTMSIWAIGDSGGEMVGGTTYFAHLRHGNAPIIPLTSYMTWTRLQSHTGGNNNFHFRSKWNYGAGDICISSSTFRAFGAQLEDEEAGYASSYIPTDASPVTRAAEELYTDEGLAMAPGGYYHAQVVFRPRYPSGRMEKTTNPHYILYFDSNNNVYIKAIAAEPTKKAICQLTDGQELCSVSGQSWDAEQELTITVEHKSSGRLLAIAGTNEGSSAVNGAPANAISGGTQIHILSQPGGASQCAELRNINFYPL